MAQNTNTFYPFEKELLPTYYPENKTVRKYAIKKRMQIHNIPGASVAIVSDGKLVFSKSFGWADTETRTKTTSKTLFQAGSISKPIAALAVLKLMEEGKVTLDEDVNNYLKSWKVPENKFTRENKVTLRQLLTHTAGVSIHGFPGYEISSPIPTNLQVLNGEGNTAKIEVDTIPGSSWRYSGGGYTIMEQVVEDITGQPFADYMDNHILKPLGMNNSTYSQPIQDDQKKNASAAFDFQGQMIPGKWHNYPEQAAAGLWTTAEDLARYCMAVQEMLKEDSPENLLRKSTVEMMLTKNKYQWGLGPIIQWAGDSLIFKHGGKNAGFTNDMLAFASRGDAIVVMTNADNGTVLIWEIIRAASAQFNWNIASSKPVTIISQSKDDLSKFEGEYISANDSTIHFHIQTRKHHLKGKASALGAKFKWQPTESERFVDLKRGETVKFLLDDNKEVTALLLKGYFRFDKVN